MARRPARRSFVAAPPGRSRGAAIHGDVDGVRRHLGVARRGGDRSAVTSERQTLTVSAAARRARAGNRTVARRLAWRAIVLKSRRHGEWLLSRWKALELDLARLRREPSHPDCAACSRREGHVRELRDEYLAEIARLPGSVPTYADYRHREAEGDRWLRRQLEGLRETTS
jgi:hypothetical protein